MTSTTLTPTQSPRSARATHSGNTTGMQRIWSVVKLQFTNKWTLIGVPWIVVAGIFLVNLAFVVIFTTALTGSDQQDAVEGTQYNGMTFYLFVYMLVVAIQAISMTFPFALGYGVTRRDYYLGTSLAFVLLSAAYSCALTLLSYIEEWTGGWGLHATIFTSVYFGAGALWQRLFIFFVGLLFFFFVGMASGTIYMRWKANGLLTYGAILTLLIVGSIALITYTQSWGAVAAWFVASGPFGVVAWLLVPTVISAVIGFFIMRYATPKS